MSLTPEQLEMRRTMLTATDIVKLSGASPWGGPHQVWLDKVKGETEFKGNQATRIGERLEPIILAMLAEERSLTLTPGETERSASEPWAGATPDANVIILPSAPQRVALAEAKAVGLRLAHKWTEESPPDYVVVQCAWQMAVTRVPLVYVPALIGTELRVYEVHRDADLEGALVELGRRFWTGHVLPKAPPPADGSEAARKMLQAVWPKHNAGLVSAPAEAEEIARMYLEAQRAEDDARARKALAQQRLCELIGDHEGVVSPNWKATWKLQKEVQVPAHTRASNRVFRFSVTKGEAT